MKSFLIKIGFFIFLSLVMQIGLSFYGLMKLFPFQYPSVGAVKLIQANSFKANTIMIGCSNLQHNYDYNNARDLDVLYFAGSQNITFLEYLVSKKIFDNYENIILYLPYHFYYEAENSIALGPSSYENYLCFDYVMSNIRSNPINLFNTKYRVISDSISRHREKSTQSNFITNSDNVMDSLRQFNTNYRDCANIFNLERHEFKFNKIDFDLVINLFDKRQHVKIIFPPIAKTSNNLDIVKRYESFVSMRYSEGLFLNKPFVMDQEFWYDQWYHLNKCGSDIETKRINNYLLSR